MSVSLQRRERAEGGALSGTLSAVACFAAGGVSGTEGASSIFQSEGAYSIPQKFPGTSSSKPTSQVSGLPPSGTTSATRAVVWRMAETISSLTWIPCGTARGTIMPHPCAFTRVVLQRSENGWLSSRLVTNTGTSSGNRGLRRIACCGLVDGPIESAQATLLHGLC